LGGGGIWKGPAFTGGIGTGVGNSASEIRGQDRTITWRCGCASRPQNVGGWLERSAWAWCGDRNVLAPLMRQFSCSALPVASPSTAYGQRGADSRAFPA
jgi:hypothetical protein